MLAVLAVQCSAAEAAAPALTLCVALVFCGTQ